MTVDRGTDRGHRAAVEPSPDGRREPARTLTAPLPWDPLGGRVRPEGHFESGQPNPRTGARSRYSRTIPVRARPELTRARLSSATYSRIAGADSASLSAMTSIAPATMSARVAPIGCPNRGVGPPRVAGHRQQEAARVVVIGCGGGHDPQSPVGPMVSTGLAGASLRTTRWWQGVLPTDCRTLSVRHCGSLYRVVSTPSA